MSSSITTNVVRPQTPRLRFSYSNTFRLKSSAITFDSGVPHATRGFMMHGNFILENERLLNIKSFDGDESFRL
jgi:hypothetical protein